MRPLILLLALPFAPPAFAQVVNVPPVVVSTLTHVHQSFMGITSTRDVVSFPCSGGACSGPGFTASIGTGTEVVSRFQAPPGYRFRVILQPGGSQILAVSAFWFTGTSDSTSGSPTYTIAYENLTGTTPVNSYTSIGVSNAGHAVTMTVYEDVLGDFTFTALEIRQTVGHALASVPRTYGAVDSSSQYAFGSHRNVGGAATDATVMVIEPIPVPAGAYCFGDGLGTSCPCSPLPFPHGAPGRGCPHPGDNLGSMLETFGTPSLSADSLMLFGSFMSNSSCLYYQGNARENAGLGSHFGDGLRCATGGVRRFLTQMNVGHASQYPGPGQPLISVAGAIAAPGTKHYQAWFRSAAPGFCTVATYNLTNGVSVTWTL